MTRLGIALAVVLAIGIALWAIRRDGYRAGERDAENRMQALVDAANVRVAQVDAQSRSVNEVTNREIATLRSERDAANERARAVIRPVRLCSSPRSGELPRVAGTSGARSDSETKLPVPAGADPGAAPALSGDKSVLLLQLVQLCQADNDAAVAWEQWYGRHKLVQGLGVEPR